MSVLIRNCPHCPAQHSSFTLMWSAHMQNTHPIISTNAALCGACGRPICFLAKNEGGGSSKPTEMNGTIEPSFTINKIWPSRPEPAAPLHLPAPVKARFLEEEDAFDRGKWNSAVAMYRSALDIATKGMPDVPTGTFFKRLEWLADNHAITADIRSWADHVRIEGNAALHDPDEFAEGDAKSLRFFTEMFLRYVFELPGAVR